MNFEKSIIVSNYNNKYNQAQKGRRIFMLARVCRFSLIKYILYTVKLFRTPCILKLVKLFPWSSFGIKLKMMAAMRDGN